MHSLNLKGWNINSVKERNFLCVFLFFATIGFIKKRYFAPPPKKNVFTELSFLEQHPKTILFQIETEKCRERSDLRSNHSGYNVTTRHLVSQSGEGSHRVSNRQANQERVNIERTKYILFFASQLKIQWLLGILEFISN